MKIWIINHYAMPPKYEVRLRTLMMATFLQEARHTVRIFSASTIHNTNINLISKSGPLFIEQNYEGLNFVHIKTSRYYGNGFSRLKNMLQFSLRLIKVAKRINEIPDVIVCDLSAILAPIPFFISKCKGAKFILEVRDLWPESIVVYKKLSEKNPIIKFMYLIEKWIYKKSDIIVFSMEGGRDYITDKGWDKCILMSKIYHINNGVNLAVFNENKEKFTFKDDDLDDTNTFKVMYTGSIRLANNLKKLVEVARITQRKQYTNIKFLIFGDGDDRPLLEEYCKKNGIENIRFKGYIDKWFIPYVLSKSDINILHFEQNSLKKYGSSLNKMFEYFASGKPTISDCQFGYDLINRYNAGISKNLVEPEKIADTIITFYNMGDKDYANYCQNALRAASNFDYKLLMREFEKLVSQVNGGQKE